MADSETIGGMKVLEPDGYLQPKRYEITCRCLICGETYSFVTSKLDGKDRPHMKKSCREFVAEEQREREAANREKMFREQRAPGHIGDKTIVRAIDATAEIVMRDHNVTDLRDNIREGENMAPKLPERSAATGMPMAAAAAGFFDGSALRGAMAGQRQAQRLGQRAIHGAFRSMSVNPGEILGKREPGEKALRHIGTEKLHGN